MVTSGLIAELRGLADQGIGVLLITHDLALLPGFATTICVMDRGTIVEKGPAAEFIGDEISTDAARRLIAAARRVGNGAIP